MWIQSTGVLQCRETPTLMVTQLSWPWVRCGSGSRAGWAPLASSAPLLHHVFRTAKELQCWDRVPHSSEAGPCFPSWPSEDERRGEMQWDAYATYAMYHRQAVILATGLHQMHPCSSNELCRVNEDHEYPFVSSVMFCHQTTIWKRFQFTDLIGL